MKLVIAGSRSLDNYPNWLDFLTETVRELKLSPTEIISGDCWKGPDRWAKIYAELYKIPCTKMPANWQEFGKSAGTKRNKEMANYGESLLLFWDGKSSGSKNMKSEMKKLHKPIYEFILEMK